MNFSPASAAARGLARCEDCGRVEPVAVAHCPRCHAPLHLRKADALQRTIALTLGAAVLYLPANLLPVMRVESSLKGTNESTIVGGVIQFWQTGDYPVALIIFTAPQLRERERSACPQSGADLCCICRQICCRSCAWKVR